MNELEINGKTYPIKFNHRFYDRIVSEYARKNKDSNVDGFNNLIEGLISQDPDAVINAYRCACQSKSLPSVNAVGDALEESGIFDSADVFNREAELGVEVAKQNYELAKKQLQELSK